MILPTFPELKQLPEPPYFCAIFISELSNSTEGYDEMDAMTIEKASKSDGYIGYVSSRSKEGSGIFISYWSSLEAIDGWRKNSIHRMAKEMGRKEWYTHYISQICEIKSHGIKS